MTIQKKLLVLVDGSDRSMQTINYVKEFMPVDENTRIVLFHVFSGIPEEYRELEENPTCHSAVRQLRDRETEQQRKTRAYLERGKKILITRGFSEQSIEIKFHSLEKGVAMDIIDEARNGYSAVVLRRRGIGALKSIILGSVAVKLLQSLTFIPIIIVGQAPPVKRILFAVDTSPSSMKAVEFASSLLGGHGYEACIFHAIISLGAINFELLGVNEPEMPDNCIEALKSKVMRTFKVLKDMLMVSGFESEKISEKIITGANSRSCAIVEEAEDGGYGTIVVGRRGLSKVEAFFMGRVSNKVVHVGNKFTVWVVP
ncbi:MAG: universal stress protein [Desulfobacteraceae bacterium]|nr:universal stress protein [Desulfobacteraceae bacterium]MBC2756134.1 universal stress protein [Desulfobacteraceae bacterium]